MKIYLLISRAGSCSVQIRTAERKIYNDKVAAQEQPLLQALAAQKARLDDEAAHLGRAPERASRRKSVSPFFHLRFRSCTDLDSSSFSCALIGESLFLSSFYFFVFMSVEVLRQAEGCCGGRRLKEGWERRYHFETGTQMLTEGVRRHPIRQARNEQRNQIHAAATQRRQAQVCAPALCHPVPSHTAQPPRGAMLSCFDACLV